MNLWKTFFGLDPKRTREFPGQQPGEEVELMTAFHWISLAPFFLQLGLVFILFLTFYFSEFSSSLSQVSRTFILTLSLALMIHLVCFRLYNYFLKVILVTNFRVIDIRHTVFLKREREAIPMYNVQDFRYKQNGILQRIFNYGTLMILGSSTDVKYVFRYVPKVNKVHHILGEIHQKALHQRDLQQTSPAGKALPQEG